MEYALVCDTSQEYIDALIRNYSLNQESWVWDKYIQQRTEEVGRGKI